MHVQGRFLRGPTTVAAAAALAVRLATGLQGLARNPLLTSPQLDSDYYVEWARMIWRGDVTGAPGPAHSAYILNPLYAFFIAPIAGIFADPALPIVVLQALLAAATAGLAAAAAKRFFGAAAAWTAGLAVAFSTALVQLDAHVAVSGLAAFLTAGAVFSAAPPRDGASSKGHGPVAAGLWLGLGALARPIAPLALPFFAWRQWKDGGLRRAAVVVVVFAACAVPSFLRNWITAGDPAPYTKAGGLNIHLGNNPVARKYRTMASACFSFSPIHMHEDARMYVARAVGHDPSPSEVSSYFTRMTVNECINEPLASAAFYANKARWFASPVETPSSASLANDRRFTPLLAIAFVPTWLLAAAGIVGAIVHRRRREILCGPTALVLAHLAVLTLVFPLSHYRSPAIPALAVLAGGAVQAALDAWRSGARRTTIAVAAGVAVTAIVGALPPQPDPAKHADANLLALYARDHKQWDDAERYAQESLAAFREQWPDYDDLPAPWFLLGEISVRRGRWPEAKERLTKGLSLDRGNWAARLELSRVLQKLGDLVGAEREARVVADDVVYRALPDGHARLGEVLWMSGRYDLARRELAAAVAGGAHVDPEILRQLR